MMLRPGHEPARRADWPGTVQKIRFGR